jgi:hypothetical protein
MNWWGKFRALIILRYPTVLFAQRVNFTIENNINDITGLYQKVLSNH